MNARERLLRKTRHELGQMGEKLCERIFHNSGLRFIPLCKHSDRGAPMLLGKDKVILPDFDVKGGTWDAYIDAKAKTRCVVYRNANNEVRHGIPVTNYEHYVKMGIIDRKQAGVLLVELLDENDRWSGTLLAESFINLGKPFPGIGSMTDTVFWPRKRFVDLDSLLPEEIESVCSGSLSRSYAAELQDIFTEKPRSQRRVCTKCEFIDVDAGGGVRRRQCAHCGKVDSQRFFF